MILISGLRRSLKTPEIKRAQKNPKIVDLRITKTSAVRSRVSSKLIFASCVGYFDRAYYGFHVTSSRMSALIEGNKI